MNALHSLTPHPPMTIVHPLDAAVRDLERTAERYLDADAPSILTLLAEADQLARTDALEASHLKGRIHTLTGDRAQLDYWFHNARRLNGGWRVLHDHCACLLNLGHFAPARELLKTLLTMDAEGLPRAVEMAVIAGDLSGAVAALAKLQKGQADIDATLSEYAHVGLEVAAACGCTEACAWNMLDVAGEMLQASRLFWIDPRPRFMSHDCSYGDGRGTLCTISIPLPMEEASQFNLDFVHRLIERDLCMDAFSLCFSGASFSSNARSSRSGATKES